jgi:hypothetical protein
MDYIGPDTKQLDWRDLFDDLHGYEGDRWAEEVILPWADRHPAVIRELADIGRPECRRARLRSSYPRFGPAEGLYALGRVLDVLIAPFQPVNDDPELLNWVTGQPWWAGRLAGRPALPVLAAAAGWTRISEDAFCPFFHEIVTVEPAEDPEANPELVTEVWPGFMAGSMMLVRAGVVIRAGANVADPQAASQSPMYWAWWRRNRVPTDPSHGWGGNSQWASAFRRDYLADGELHYNVDAYQSEADLDLSEETARELVRFRCNLLHVRGMQHPYGHEFSEPYHPGGS